MTLRRVALEANDSKVGGPAAWVRPGYDNLILDDVAICGSGTAPILGQFVAVGPYLVVSACLDCNGGGRSDFGEVMTEAVGDCNDNLIPDSCDIASGVEQDCNGNGKPDACDIADGTPDCNGNGVPDSCDIASGKSEDRNNEGCTMVIGNGIPDECEVGRVIRLPYPKLIGQSGYALRSAVCEAVDGMIIELEPGVWGPPNTSCYLCGTDLGSKRVTLRSVEGPEVTILDGLVSTTAASKTVVAIGPSAASGGIRPVLQGLTIRLGEGGTPFPGSATPVGAGLRLLDTDALIEDCIIELSFASGGAGVAIKGGSPILRNCVIRHNDSMGHGGGILLIDTNATIEDCTIFDNVAIGRGGGVHAVGGSPTIEGTLLDYNDSASQGGGVSWMGTSAAGGRLLVDDCVVQDNLAVGGGGLWIKPGVSNLHLRATGLCGNEPEQILGAYVDLGGNGGCGIGCPADLTGDAEVNGADLTVLLSAWGPLGGIADLNGDGVVNGADLAALLAAWGSCQ
ncbi:MAG: right-handed parallel beta-helix repeat-containing protein [Deltaproteobacteria bacterium]|nr:right-handed parallel beta-helix repeat-containing protein [Deltaproteobacteria bacterium]